ncbi:MAG: SagB/ThcOx family dehydrogenase [Armatimonadota bacterium]
MRTSNRSIDATWTYHNGTKHSYQSVRAGTRGLDWANQPLPYKIYSTLNPIPLPKDSVLAGQPALEVVKAPGAEPAGRRMPDLRTLAGILFLSAGITKRLTSPRGATDFRAAACTGALYHIELYLVCGDLPGAAGDDPPDLPAGVYHFSVHDFALRKLRSSDYRGAVVRASGGEASIASAAAIVVCTTTFWRNAWKYGARAYRHAFWDSGTILANLLAAAAGCDMPARVVCGFVDAQVNRLLDLDTEREVAIALVALGRDGTSPSAPFPEMRPLGAPVMPLSKKEIDYPAIRAMHAASSLQSEEEAKAWRGRPPEGDTPAPSGELVPIQAPGDAAVPNDAISKVIVSRGSSRQFARKPITFTQLSTMLDRATRGVPADFLEPPDVSTLNTLYVIVHAVEGLRSGAYVFHRDRRALELLREGNFRDEAGYLGLGQALPADASVNVYFLANLSPILERFGNRGYRAAQLEAAIAGGKLYLAAYALRLGATGLTFYDDDVTAFFSPHAAGKSVMFLTALGRPMRRRTPRIYG